MCIIKIRFLTLNDSAISYLWRNKLELWQLTGRNWNNFVTEEIERAWIEDVISRKDERRFAICVGIEEKYIGNAYLTNINNTSAEFHIFIGEIAYWGKGFGKHATELVIDYGFKELGLKRIYLRVREDNVAALKLYEKCNFEINTKVDNFLIMERQNDDFAYMP